MHSKRDIRSALAGLVLGLGAAWGIGAAGAQPEAPADPIVQRLALLHTGLFREESLLPTDPALSIEQMLEDQGAAIERLQARLAGLDARTLEAIQQSLGAFEAAAAGLDTPGVGGLHTEVESVRRSMEEMTRKLEQLERDDIAEIQRSLDDLERSADGRGERSLDSIEREMRDLKSALQDVKRTVEAIERKIP